MARNSSLDALQRFVRFEATILTPEINKGAACSLVIPFLAAVRCACACMTSRPCLALRPRDLLAWRMTQALLRRERGKWSLYAGTSRFLAGLDQAPEAESEPYGASQRLRLHQFQKDLQTWMWQTWVYWAWFHWCIVLAAERCCGSSSGIKALGFSARRCASQSCKTLGAGVNATRARRLASLASSPKEQQLKLVYNQIVSSLAHQEDTIHQHHVELLT